MKIKKVPAKTVLAKLYCACGKEMEFEGLILDSYPAKYPHFCNKCKSSQYADKIYPCFEHLEETEIIKEFYEV